MSNKEPKASDLPLLPAAIAGILFLWISSYQLVTHSFDKWADRGTFGDSFGAVNSLFSGFAMLGVGYAVFLQRREMTETLTEMRRARELSTQPLLKPVIYSITIEPPKLHSSVQEFTIKHTIQCRVEVSLGLENPTEFPAIGVLLRPSFRFPEGKGETQTSDLVLEYVAAKSTSKSTYVHIQFDDNKELIMSGLVEYKQFEVNSMKSLVELVFRNSTGGYFFISQEFEQRINFQDRRILRNWIKIIQTFRMEYPDFFDVCFDLTSDNDRNWKASDEEIKAKWENVPDADFNNVCIGKVNIPSTFQYRLINESEYITKFESSKLAVVNPDFIPKP